MASHRSPPENDHPMVAPIELICRPDPKARPASPAAPARVLVLGVGNVLMGDEGVGVHVLQALEHERSVEGVRLLDCGTGGINLLLEIEGAGQVLLIDATRDGQPAGTVTYLQPKTAGDLPRALTAHDFGLKDLFATAALLGGAPEMHLVTISVEEIHPMCLELSPEVAAAVPEAVHTVRALMARLAAGG